MAGQGEAGRPGLRLDRFLARQLGHGRAVEDPAAARRRPVVAALVAQRHLGRRAAHVATGCVAPGLAERLHRDAAADDSGQRN
ncbi:MAG: hypothetical protein ACK5QX_01960 [bacterium]